MADDPIKKGPQSDTIQGSIEELIMHAVRRAVNDMNLVQRLTVDVDETAAMLGCSVSQVNNLETAGILTDVSYDSRKRFNIEQVKALARKPKKK
jgi:hypothetical protein